LNQSNDSLDELASDSLSVTVILVIVQLEMNREW